MSTSELLWTPGPYEVRAWNGGEWPLKRISIGEKFGDREALFINARFARNAQANGQLMATAPCMYDEMARHLPILQRLESDPYFWEKLTEGLGIATLNGYRHVMAKARGETPNVERGGTG